MKGRKLYLAAALLVASVPQMALAQEEYVAGVRIEAPANLVVDQTVPIQIRFVDSLGDFVAPEPGRTISVAPSGIFPCLVARCANSDYSESFVTAPGQDVYTVYLRSMAAGFNAVTITHPNGSQGRANFESSAGGGGVAAGGGGSFSASSTSSFTSSSTAGTPNRFALPDGNPSVQLGSCTQVRVNLLDSAGNLASLNSARAVSMNPGGGIYPSSDQCASYRSDPVTVAAGSTQFSFYAYVVSEYSGLGRITLTAPGMNDLQIPFLAGSGGTVSTTTPAPAPQLSQSLTTPAPVEFVAPPASANVVVWANDGGEKIVQEETRSFERNTNNSVWDGTTIRTFAGRNEVVSFNVIVDNRGPELNQVSVDFSRLANENFVLETTNSTPDTLFDWRTRPIEVFSVGYLKVHGISRIAYELYDETHIPEKLRRPFVNLQPEAPAIGSGTWFDRPNHDKSYPDIAIPQEVQPQTYVAPNNSQSFWVDVYVPKNVPAGKLYGTVRISNGGAAIANVPVELTVADFTLNDESKAKSMVYIGDKDLAERYFTGAGAAGSLPESSYDDYRTMIDRHYMLAWRHHISLIDGNALVANSTTPIDAPNEDWQRRLRGGLYTAENGYVGPGQNLPHDVFSIGTYSNWQDWWDLTDYDPTNSRYNPNLPRPNFVNTLRTRTDQWETWFRVNAPSVKRFLYADDEPGFTQSRDPNFSSEDFVNLITDIVKSNPGPGSALPTFVTASPLGYQDELPTTSLLGDVISHGETEKWEAATQALAAAPDRDFFMYNGRRPASGTFVTDDDGVALRELPWGQYKKGISRWFYWHGAYYNNFQGGPASRDLSQVDPQGPNYRSGSQTNLFKSAMTFGGHTHFDPVYGESGWNYSNGDGVLFYPGTDQIFPDENRGLMGPIASLRLKHWRRGIQDVIYLEQAMAVDAAATQAIINEMVPEAMWEVGVANPEDPTYVHKPPSWSTNPDDWEDARRRLANIILGYDGV